MTTSIVKQEQKQDLQQVEQFSAFGSIVFFENAQRMAKMLSCSSIVPETYKGEANLGNCVIALEISNRIGANVLAVMQNLYIVHGRPAWSSQFLISCINASRRFSPLRYKATGVKGQDSWGCIAWATDSTGEVLESPEVTLGMAKAEGWYQRNGSKWKTMPELMLRYRAATFFARMFAPELTMGIRTDDEVIDIGGEVTVQGPKAIATPIFAEPAKLPPAPDDHNNPPPTPVETRQATLAKYLSSENGVSFDDFRDFITAKNIASNADTWASWDEVPEPVIEALNIKLMAEIVRKFGKAPQS